MAAGRLDRWVGRLTPIFAYANNRDGGSDGPLPKYESLHQRPCRRANTESVSSHNGACRVAKGRLVGDAQGECLLIAQKCISRTLLS